ncbi:uncharacterized protein LOC143596729 [Bidens hawaiensis]|uniref:uncharacterized protein LOC143596729 n=1 Tax=Bidens hawaiensis TaxID=980011 RepID=UPI0040497AAA
MPVKKSIPVTWKNIVKVEKDIVELGINLHKTIRWEVKDEKKILFWLENWCGGTAFFERFPLLFGLEMQKLCKVADRLIMFDGEICGQWSWSRGPQLLAEINELRDLLVECREVRLTGDSDLLVWGLEDGPSFSVKSVKNKLALGAVVDGRYSFEWNRFVPKKVAILAWRAEMERIPSLFSLAKRNIPFGSLLCPFCSEELETAEHLFVTCQFAHLVWSVISCWCKVPPIYAFSTRDLLELHRFSCLPNRKAKVTRYVSLRFGVFGWKEIPWFLKGSRLG